MTNIVSNRVLVLNKSWAAVGVSSVQRAITLLFNNYTDGSPKARIIDPTTDFTQYTWEDWSKLTPADGEDVIRGIGLEFRVPEVILLTRYDKMPFQRVNFSRRTIYRRDGYRCQYCSDRPPWDELTIDHIVPRAQGGETTWKNCVVACFTCNSQKADRRPEEARKEVVSAEKRKNWKGPSPMQLRREPFKPKFSLFKAGSKIPLSWKNFISEAYWETELENDNVD